MNRPAIARTQASAGQPFARLLPDWDSRVFGRSLEDLTRS